jgi:cellobiose phosphorylase
MDFSAIRYVITLDSDTVLPIGMAKRMIGTMAHPLNRPVIDNKRGIVIDGYGLMQPRVDFDSENSGRSPVSKIYTGQMGIDPYASAISDIYQDMFGEGIYTGKGIYDLKVFQQVLKNAIPENKILSHDLYEGSYVRAALITNLKLVESYPTKYNSLSARLYRWVRGDWQLAPFLSVRIHSGTSLIRNPLTLLSKWKIFDNLRRSLVAPALMVLILLGLSVLPGSSLLWLGYAMVALLFPLLSSILNYVLSGGPFKEKIKSYIPIIIGLKAMLLQAALTFLFLPYQAYSMVKAAVLTLWRVYVSKKNMLEWVTSADFEAGQKDTLASYYEKMHPSVWMGLIAVMLVLAFRPGLTIVSLVLLAVWSASPFIACQISRDYRDNGNRLSEKDEIDLGRIARGTWRYFEEFAGPANNYLPADNYQQDPYRGVAPRTSPTNIGLGLLSILTARDMGYIGNYEMVGMISRTVSTIEQLKKWNGHLYNWYDTATLKPLNPGYISTVDSGNLVCYLTVLAQGLKDCLAHPIADPQWIGGIIDTLHCAQQDGLEASDAAKYLNELEGKGTLPLTEWMRTLRKLSAQGGFAGWKGSPWKEKIEQMIKTHCTELAMIAPWAESLNAVPQALTARLEGRDAAKLRDTIARLDIGLSMRGIQAACGSALAFFQRLAETYGRAEDESAAWLSQICGALLQSIQSAEAFAQTIKDLAGRIRALSDAAQFLPLFDEKRQLFSIGYSTREKKLTGSYYDLLASESRQTSFIAIARGEIPASHWFRMGRTLTVMDGYKGLVSWTGTMFEYLMPLLIMKSYKNTLLDETYAFAVRSQKKYGAQRGIPWGTSESGYSALNNNLDYKYKAIGVPWLGLKRGLLGDAVTAPYATFLALMVDPVGAMKNIRRLETEGLEGDYGFFEAADYTPDRLTNGNSTLVKSFMAHHQGMSLLAINNCLHANIMQRRFLRDPAVRSARLLLQEKVPENVVFTKEAKEKVISVKGPETVENNLVRCYHRPDPALPKAHILSNGEYSVMLTDRGTGYSKYKDIEITRWREDSALDPYGMFFFFRNVETDAVWSSAFAPYNRLPEKYEVTFAPDKAQFKQVDRGIETLTEVVVASGDAVEIRRITLRNLGQKPVMVELTSCFEAVLASQAQDVAHPAFSNLFVKTEYLPDMNCLVATRRSKSNAETTWCAANTVVAEEGVKAGVAFETDRMKFIGRGRGIASPAETEYGVPLSNTAGAVLDPVMSLRLRVSIDPGKAVPVSFVTAVGHDRELLLSLAEKYSTAESVEAAFHLAKVRSQLESKYLNIPASSIELYEEMISHILFISPLKRLSRDLSEKNARGQSSLWAYGVSGDLPIMLVVIDRTEEPALVHEALKAHEYWWRQGLKVDAVILANIKNSYNPPFNDLISQFEAGRAHDQGRVFILNSNETPVEDIRLFYAAARIVVKDAGGTLAEQMHAKQEPAPQKLRRFAHKGRKYAALTAMEEPSLRCFNGLGGYHGDGAAYEIRLSDGLNTPAPWINVVANPGFGFLVSESGSACTWCGNSRENKLTPWSNDPVCDSSGEALYLTDDDTGETWTATALPAREPEPYKIVHGFGYSAFEHSSHGISQRLVQFVPMNDPVKVSLLTLKNDSNQKRELSLTYYIRPVLGVSDQDTAMHVRTRLGQSGAMLVENPYNEEFSGYTAFLDSSIKERTVTGDRKEFFGAGGAAAPDALKYEKLSGAVGAGFDPCAALQVIVTLLPKQSTDIVFLLGMCRQAADVDELAQRYASAPQARSALEEVKAFWAEKLSILRVETPSEPFDLLMNGWLQYQALSCRLWARSSFYQSGGAFGFRDQLQDCLSVVYIWPEAVRSQILLHARHQFKEGDVQHWWHEPWGRGTRTRCSDDLLWLPYVTAEYIRVTGDSEILKEQLPYLEDAVLSGSETERYSRPHVSNQTAALYEHCVLAIEKASVFGARGLPLMGSGDWNDGMNTVGIHGLGESVWLGWFMSSVLKSFAPICALMGERSRAQGYTEAAARLTLAIEKSAWDGRWYQRATFDDGRILGSRESSECRIDSIAQSWAVLSGGGDPQRAAMAMDSINELLVDRETGIIKLLAPPFDRGDMEPGYIKGYLPGVRENGGQYTHAAAWAIMAWAKLGRGDKAWEYFDLINPVNHALTGRECATYKLEPYVVAADVYAAEPHAGRGGWSWYTGSASWLYKAGMEGLLGLRKNGDSLTIDPCISSKWPEFCIQYRYVRTLYVIRVHNPEGLEEGAVRISVNGDAVQGNAIGLIDDGAIHDVDVLMHSAVTPL